MFAKLNDRRQYQQQEHHRQIHQEEESEFDGVRCISKRPKAESESRGGEEGTIEGAKRARGRPPGSKNKPKAPTLIIRREAECAMRPVFLELPTGLDIIDAIAGFTHRRNVGLTVLTASGAVTNVSFRQPTTSTAGDSNGGIVKFPGRFEILSISATFLPPSLPITSSPSLLPSSFMISLVGAQGQIIGGSIAGSLITSTTVYIVAASFDNPTYHRLPIQQVEQQHHHDSSNSCAMSLPPPHHDLIWSPTPRSSPPF